ncbi:MAG: methyltransferase domain-containing protein [Oscillospiraceae bacterium]|jgi:2-polyprenyl-3-methyl-5-hydroxy-6-metoxy-1,4-benzoquinol methylase|nr:methyltransferase domain-containing protein [Oscillospiraceae bacterium]
MSYITDYYNSYNEDARTKSRHGSVEFTTNMKYIRAYVAQGGKILDVGAGTGVYSMALAMDGYDVHALELVEHNIEVFRANLRESGADIPLEQGNALDLSRFADGSFDAVILFGPLYHLYSKEDKLTVLREAKRVLKPDGHIFAAYCMNEATIIQYAFKGDGSNMMDCLTKGLLTADYHCISEPAEIFEQVRLEDIDELNRETGLKRVKIVSSDLFTHYIQDRVDNFSDEVYQAYIKYHLAICERPDLLGVTNHSLDILVKE